MKIIISPSKTLKPSPYSGPTQIPQFYDKAMKLKHILQNYEPQHIKNHLHVSEKLANEVYQRLKDDTLYPALYYYTGTVFKQLELKNYQDEHLEYLNQHLYILDALYGALRYNDLISFYRLDYLSQIEDIDLYTYWQEDLKHLFMEEDYMINLASNEYAKSIQHGHMITIDFCIQKNGRITRPSMLIKKARGAFLNAMILQKVNNLETLKNITVDDFCFNEKLSSSTHYVYLKTTD